MLAFSGWSECATKPDSSLAGYHKRLNRTQKRTLNTSSSLRHRKREQDMDHIGRVGVPEIGARTSSPRAMSARRLLKGT